jgi:uncharacterized protein YprB with RNaseH-like and TPR domain
MRQISCCCFDLECTNLNADYGVLLCAVIKPAGGRARILRADELNPRWRTRRSDDRTLIAAVVDELQKYDIWVAHNGARFDVAFLRTRLARWGMEALPTRKLVDPVQLARLKLRASGNSLEALGELLGLPAKRRISPQLWLEAALDGSHQAMDRIASHCVRDVKILEGVLNVVKSYVGQLNAWGSAY